MLAFSGQVMSNVVSLVSEELRLLGKVFGRLVLVLGQRSIFS